MSSQWGDHHLISFQVFVLRTAFGNKKVFISVSDPDQSTGLAEIFGFEGSIFQFE